MRSRLLPLCPPPLPPRDLQQLPPGPHPDFWKCCSASKSPVLEAPCGAGGTPDSREGPSAGKWEEAEPLGSPVTKLKT